ncbi:hypothetical protein Avbf_19201, partial [Armadillidium vulgare]
FYVLTLKLRKSRASVYGLLFLSTSKIISKCKFSSELTKEIEVRKLMLLISLISRREVKNETISAYTSLEVFILRNLKKKKKKVSPDKSLLFRFKVMK